MINEIVYGLFANGCKSSFKKNVEVYTESDFDGVRGR